MHLCLRSLRETLVIRVHSLTKTSDVVDCDLNLTALVFGALIHVLDEYQR